MSGILEGMVTRDICSGSGEGVREVVTGKKGHTYGKGDVPVPRPGKSGLGHDCRSFYRYVEGSTESWLLLTRESLPVNHKINVGSLPCVTHNLIARSLLNFMNPQHTRTP